MFLFMTEGNSIFCLEDADTIGLSIFFCLQQKSIQKKPKKKQKLNWNTELGPFARESGIVAPTPLQKF